MMLDLCPVMDLALCFVIVDYMYNNIHQGSLLSKEFVLSPDYSA